MPKIFYKFDEETNSLLPLNLKNSYIVKKFLYFLLMFMIGIGCSNDGIRDGDDSQLKTCLSNSNCDDCVIIDKELYKGARTGNYNIQNVRLNENCLEITFASGGCSGSTWETELIEQGDPDESNPGFRNVRLSLINIELCEAYITKTRSFNIAPLQGDAGELYLNIEGWDDPVLYQY